MKLYHYSVSYKSGDSLKNDYNGHYALSEPFILALEKGMNTFTAVYLSALYTARELRSLKLRTYENCQKDAVEAIFEYVRRTEYPSAVSRLNCVFYCETREEAVKYALDDCIDCGDFTKDEVALLEVEADESRVARYDQTFYNEAYESAQNHSFEKVFECARSYYSGTISDNPLIEILADGENTILARLDY